MRRAAGASRFLYAAGVHDEQALRWANQTRIVPVGDVCGQEPSIYDAGLSFIASSIEIGVRRAKALKFISHLDILRERVATERYLKQVVQDHLNVQPSLAQSIT